MFLQQPYDSKTLVHTDKTHITYLVNRYNINDYSYIAPRENLLTNGLKFNRDFPLRPVVLFGLSDTEKEIPELEFPFLDPKGNWVCFDMRRYYTVNKKTLDVSIKRASDVDFIMTRNMLCALWMAGESNELSFLNLPMEVYGKWMSNLIAGKFGLDVAQEADIDILARIYYMRQFSDKASRDNEKEKILNKFKTSYYTVNMVERVYDLCDDMETLEDFARHCYIVTENVRVQGLSPAVIYRLTQVSWMGVGSQDNLALALEYPPIWISMVYSSLKDNIFKRTTIGSVAQTLSKKGNGQAFLTSVDEMLRQVGG